MNTEKTSITKFSIACLIFGCGTIVFSLLGNVAFMLLMGVWGIFCGAVARRKIKSGNYVGMRFLILGAICISIPLFNWLLKTTYLMITWNSYS